MISEIGKPAVREKKVPLHEPGSVFRDSDVHSMQLSKKGLRPGRLSLNVLLTKLFQGVAKTGGHYPPRSL